MMILLLLKRGLEQGVILLLWFLSIRTYLYVIIRDIQYNFESYMALALVVQETFSSLLVVTLNDVRMASMLGVGQPLVYEYSRERIMSFEKGGSYICLPSESNGPKLLDELLNNFIWFLMFWALQTRTF
jgi:hypothetical protein